MIADIYAATLNGELELYTANEEDSDIITDYRFLWTKDIIDDTKYEYYKNADEVTVNFVVVETENIDTNLEIGDTYIELKEENDEANN